MADDTLTVEQARKYIVDVWGVTPQALDALVAAVRAETGVERFVDGIIAAVVPKTLDDAGLTDAQVDAFLAAVNDAPDDPERVERIRKLFNDKLNHVDCAETWCGSPLCPYYDGDRTGS